MNDERVLRQIAAALRTAERAGTEEEADNALQVAQRLATRYSIDLAVARSHAEPARRSTPTHRTITLGEPRKRGLRTYVELFLTIARANDVTCNIAHNSTYVVAYGFEDDIALCEALYASLVVQMVRAGDAYLKLGTFRDELVWRRVEVMGRLGRPYRRWTEVPLSVSMARINFHGAFAERVGERLATAREQARAEAIAGDRAVMERTSGHGANGRPVRTGAELAIVEKAAEVADYYSAHNTARGTWRGGRAPTDVSDDAQSAGRQAGSRARLGTEQAIGGSRRAIGR